MLSLPAWTLFCRRPAGAARDVTQSRGDDAAFVQQSAAAPWAIQPRRSGPDSRRSTRCGLASNVSLGSRQAGRAVGAALGLEVPRVNALARQVPLLSSPAAIEQVMTRGPELGVPDSPQSEIGRA